MDPARRNRKTRGKNISKRLISLAAFFICPVIGSPPDHNNLKSKKWTAALNYFSALYETGQFLL
jgi:hypothetical protein